MAIQLTADDAKQSLTTHVASKGEELCEKYGPGLGWADLQVVLQDRAYVRYPCEIQFDGSPLEAGEFAHPVAKSSKPEDGFTMYVHPVYMLDLAHVSYLVLYQLVAVNYGAFASAEDAELFGANALGISRDEYYATLCELAQRIDGSATLSDDAHGHDHGPGGCSCGNT
jgi:hypothetical protein